jgi:putative zinc finger/helix-turn-helix YgiT family protein
MPDKPFPWYCTRCKRATVEPRVQRYEFSQKHDGRTQQIVIEDLSIPTCSKCGYQAFDQSTLALIADETYKQLGLLTPGQIRQKREALRLTQQQMQHDLGLGGNTLSRWERGHFYQSRVLDRFVRVFFENPDVRFMLDTETWTAAPSEPSYVEKYGHLRGRIIPQGPALQLADLWASAGEEN